MKSVMSVLLFVSVVLYPTSIMSAMIPNTVTFDWEGKKIPFIDNQDLITIDPLYQFQQSSAEYEYYGSTPSAQKSTAVFRSNDFNVVMSSMGNYNQLASKVGVHHIGYSVERSGSKLEILDKTVVRVLKRVFLPFPFFWAVEEEVVEKKILTKLTTMKFVRGNRPSITSVCTYNYDSGEEGWEDVGSLSSIPGMKAVINIFENGKPQNSENALATAYVIAGKGDDNSWDKPVIISDGFDVRNRIGIQELCENVSNSTAPSGRYFVDRLLDAGYDLIFVDYGFGSDNLIWNAKVYLRVIEEVCARATGNVTVTGYSMGGLLSQIALLIGENQIPEKIAKVKKFISIDAPHMGAQVNYDMQSNLLGIAAKPLGNVLNLVTYESVVNAAYDLNSVAAKQLLLSHPNGSNNAELLAFMKSLGTAPSSKIKKYAIADACWKWPYPGVTTGKAALLNNSSIIVKDEDLFPGSYIDLWGSDAIDYTLGTFTGLISGAMFSQHVGLATYKPTSSRYNDPIYYPTHIPLYSALGITKDVFLKTPEPTNQDDLDAIARTHSIFDKIYLVNFTDRERHIIFGKELADKSLVAMRDNSRNMDAILYLLLGD